MKKFVLAFFAVLFLAFGISYAQEPGADGFHERLKSLRDQVNRVEILKQESNSAWKTGVMEAYGQLLKLLREKPTSAEVYYLIAKCYDLNERPSKAKKALEKAIYYDHSYIKAYILMGDLNVQEIKRNLSEVQPDNYESEFFMQRDRAKKAYDHALSMPGIDKDTEGLVYLKTGDLYDLFPRDKKEAKNSWQKAVNAAPESPAAKEAQERLAKAK